MEKKPEDPVANGLSLVPLEEDQLNVRPYDDEVSYSKHVTRLQKIIIWIY